MSDRQKLPDDWNWVQHRLRCSIAGRFADLRRLADTYCEARSRQLGVRRFTVADGDAGSFRVVDESDGGSMVSFQLTPAAIHITDGPQQLNLTTFLDEHGDCVYVVGEQKLSSWQVMHKVLDRLFFANSQ